MAVQAGDGIGEEPGLAAHDEGVDGVFPGVVIRYTFGDAPAGSQGKRWKVKSGGVYFNRPNALRRLAPLGTCAFEFAMDGEDIRSVRIC